MLSKKLAEKMFDMGVSSDVILKLMLGDEEESAAPPEEKPETSEEEKPEAPKEGSKSETRGEDPVLKAIEHLTGMIAAQNIRRDYKESQKETADDILAKVLTNKGEEI